MSTRNFEDAWVSLHPNFPNYEVHPTGLARNARNHYVLKSFPDRYGYHRLSLGSVDNVYIHKLVADVFVPGFSPGFEINHIDGNKSNNHFTNIEWISKSDNIKHAISLGLQNPRLALQKAIQVNSRKVYIEGTDLVFDSIKDCAEYLGVFPQSVQRVLSGERNRIHRCVVKYA